MSSNRTTVGNLLELYGASSAVWEWPPDVFGAAMSLLHKSGAYTLVLSDQWPPRVPGKLPANGGTTVNWASHIRAVGEKWRVSVEQRSHAVPRQVSQWWGTVWSSRHRLIADIPSHLPICHALLQLCAAADEACAGVGIPPLESWFESRALLPLDSRGTLCEAIDANILRVLPKCHTPRFGITARSLSHHLCLMAGGDVSPRWNYFNLPRQMEERLNLLLVPQPRVVHPAKFRAIEGPPSNMDRSSYGYFTCDLAGGIDVARLVALCDSAKAIAGPVDMVILPELALTAPEYDRLLEPIVLRRSAMLIAGVGKAAKKTAFGENYLRLDAMADMWGKKRRLQFKPQHKHHRWLLDQRQIEQYGLRGQFPGDRHWWECIEIGRRELSFFSVAPWLTLSVLICEDLARLDPVAEVIRSVGPNLLITLLADGPQLAERWPARYATVFADDPGCSVLTLTSAGMVDLCRGPRRMLESRPVALWKDPLSGGPYEINLPADADALLVCLEVESRAEWSADGRSDAGEKGGTTRYVRLTCVHPIAARNPAAARRRP